MCLIMYVFVFLTRFFSHKVSHVVAALFCFFSVCYDWSFSDFLFFDSQTFFLNLVCFLGFTFHVFLTRSQTDSHLMICFGFSICFSHSGFPTQDSHTNFSASNKFDAGKNPTRFLSFRVECRRVRWRSVEKMEWIADPEVGSLLRNGLP